MRCSRCGLENNGDAVFCVGCGAPLAQSAPPRRGKRGIAAKIALVVLTLCLTGGSAFLAWNVAEALFGTSAQTDRVTVDPHTLVDIAYDPAAAAAAGEQAVQARVTLPDFEKLYAQAADEGDPEAFVNEQLQSGSYEKTTVTRSVTVERSGDDVKLVDEDGEKDAALNEALVGAVNAVSGGDAQ